MKTKKYSIAEAAARLGMTRAGVHAAIRQKRLKAKVGIFEVERIVKTKVKGWVIDEADFDLRTAEIPTLLPRSQYSKL